jgi:hypothetical protein
VLSFIQLKAMPLSHIGLVLLLWQAFLSSGATKALGGADFFAGGRRMDVIADVTTIDGRLFDY